MLVQYGTVISTFDSPSTRKFAFTISKDTVVHRGQFVQLDVIDGKLVGRISDIFKTNRYFMRPESVNEVEKSGREMNWDYPVWEHEYLIAEANALGVFDGKGFKESTFPPSPGTKIFEPDNKTLFDFFGLDQKGLHLGKLMHHDVEIRINPTKLLQKHLAILAISGAGKSYFTSVLLEELLNRTPEQGQISTIIIDPHGEYSSFIEDPKFGGRTKVFKSSEIRIGIPNISSYQLVKFSSDASSGVQTRELNRIIREMKDDVYGLNELIGAVEKDDKIKSATKDVLIAMLESLNHTGLFGVSDYPSLDDISKQGEISIIDLSKEINLHNKQIIVSYLAKKLFDGRRNGIIPPFLLVVEEAHQFAPEKSKQNSVSKGVIETIAREGRKFNSCLCLISQRPVQLSTTALSQCNTHIILRVTNPYDLKHIAESSEGITRSVLRQISGLQVGSGLVVGEAVNFPVFLKIRKRESKGSSKGTDLESAAAEYYKKMAQKKKDAKSFM